MRKFNPVEYNRERWGGKSYAKRHRHCTEHKYCHLPY